MRLTLIALAIALCAAAWAGTERVTPEAARAGRWCCVTLGGDYYCVRGW